jgi:hypothetical protein
MRAFVLYNDNIRGGVSLLVEGVDPKKHYEMDLDMQESIVELKNGADIAKVVASFPKKFPECTFVKGYIYEGLSRGEDVRQAEQITNAFGIRQSGYTLNKPKKTVEVQFEHS